MPSLQKTKPIKYWSAPPIWRGRTVFVIGGGPSLLKYDVNRLEGRNCIAVNNAFSIAPWSRYLVYHDRRWLDWHQEEVDKFAGIVITTNTKPPGNYVRPMKKDRSMAINCTDPTCLGGIDSGTMALNLAYHFGAKTIALVGFDMGSSLATKFGLSTTKIEQLQKPLERKGYPIPRTRAMEPGILKHWHQEHPVPPRATNYARFLKQYPAIIKVLAFKGVRLVSLTPTNIPIPHMKLKSFDKR